MFCFHSSRKLFAGLSDFISIAQEIWAHTCLWNLLNETSRCGSGFFTALASPRTAEHWLCSKIKTRHIPIRSTTKPKLIDLGWLQGEFYATRSPLERSRLHSSIFKGAPNISSIHQVVTTLLVRINSPKGSNSVPSAVRSLHAVCFSWSRFNCSNQIFSTHLRTWGSVRLSVPRNGGL